jgi:hypothetical protein
VAPVAPPEFREDPQEFYIGILHASKKRLDVIDTDKI